MAYWIASGHLVEAILGLTIVEFLVLTVYHRQTGRGLNPTRIGWTLLSGAFLLVALRGALVGSGWISIAAALTGSALCSCDRSGATVEQMSAGAPGECLA